MRGLYGRNSSDGEGAGSSESSKFYLIRREGEDYIVGTRLKPLLLGGVFLHVLAIKPSFIRYAGVYS